MRWSNLCRRFALLMLAPLLLSGCGQPAMTRGEFVERERAAGWVVIGEFGRQWPASEQRRFDGRDALRFTTADGTPHHYRGFDSYALQAVFLRSADDRETVVVLRSQQRDAALQYDVEHDEAVRSN